MADKVIALSDCKWLFSSSLLICLSACSPPVIELPPTPKLQTIQVACEQSRVPKSVVFSCEATGIYSDGNRLAVTGDATWQVSDPSIIAANQQGQANWMSGLSAGSVDVTAKMDGIEGSFHVIVLDVEPLLIFITPFSPVFRSGTVQHFDTLCIFSDFSILDVTSSSVWTSQDPSIVRISNNLTDRGTATAISEGTTTITANFNGVTDSTPVTVLDQTLIALQISPDTSTVIRGLTVPYTVNGINADLSTIDLTSSVVWSVLDDSIASISNDPIHPGQLRGTQAGSTKVIASYGGLSDTADITVTDPALQSLTLTTGSPSLASGLSESVTATGHFSDGSDIDVSEDVVWDSSSPSVLSINTLLGQRGLVTGNTIGSSIVTATLDGMSAHLTITVTAPTLSSVDVTPASPLIPLGTTQSFSAIGTYSDGSQADLTASATWTTDDPSIASVGDTGGTKGVVTGLVQDFTYVNASVNGILGYTDVTVTAAALASIAITPSATSFPLGSTQFLSAIGTLTDGSVVDVTENVNWASLNTARATISNSLFFKGTLTTLAQGNITITASLNGIVGQTTFSVVAPTLVSIAVTPSIPVIALGATQTLTAIGTFTDGSTANITSSVTWTSLNLLGATVSDIIGSKGLVTTLGLGSATITASLNGVTGQATATIVSAVLTSISITPSSPQIPVGTSQSLIAIGNYSDGSVADITSSASWGTLTPTRVTVGNSSGTKGSAKGVSTGAATITASLNGITGQTTATITAATLSSITLTPANALMSLGSTQAFVATGHLSDGTTLNITTGVSWATSDTSLATVINTGSFKGLVSAVGTGSVAVSATLNGIVGQTMINVTSATLVSISISPTASTVARGLSLQYVATGTYTDGSTADITSIVTWNSSNASITAISNASGFRGLAVGTGIGNATISASLGGLSTQTTVQVTGAVLVSIDVTPKNSSILILLQTVQFKAIGTYSDGSAVDITSSVTWVSSNTATATISTTGLASGLGIGATSISATFGGVSGSTQLNGLTL